MKNGFEDLLSQLVSSIQSIVSSFDKDFDKKSYVHLVECLKYQDSIAVKEAADQLVKEGLLVAIPPLYLASQKHPSTLARTYCLQSLQHLDPSQEYLKIVGQQELTTALKALIERYGHYENDYHP